MWHEFQSLAFTLGFLVSMSYAQSWWNHSSKPGISKGLLKLPASPVVFDAFPCMVPRALWGSFQDDEVGATRFDPGLSVAAEHITRMQVSDAIRVLRSTQTFVESDFGLVDVIYGSLTWSMRWHSYLIHLSSLSHSHSIVCKLDHASTSRLGLPFASQHFLKLGAKCRGTSRLLFWKQSLSATQDQVLGWVFGQIKHFTAEGVDTWEFLDVMLRISKSFDHLKVYQINLRNTSLNEVRWSLEQGQGVHLN